MIRTHVTRQTTDGRSGNRLFVREAIEDLTDNALVLERRLLGKRTGRHVHPQKYRHSYVFDALRNNAPEFDN